MLDNLLEYRALHSVSETRSVLLLFFPHSLYRYTYIPVLKLRLQRKVKEQLSKCHLLAR